MPESSNARGGPVRGMALAATALLVAALVTLLFVSLARESAQRVLSPAPATAADLLVCALAVVGAVLSAWLGLGVVSAALSVIPGAAGRACRTVADRIAPLAVRRAVAVVLGAALSASLASGVAVGSPTDPARPDSAPGAGAKTSVWAAPGPDLRPSTVRDAPDPSLRPAAPTTSADTGRPTATPRLAPATRPAVSGLPAVPAGPSPRHSTAETVVVRAGDTLWDIVAHELGAGATSASIAAEWPRWYRVNRDLIGVDPDLLQPGQRLVAPSPQHRVSRAGTSSGPAPTAPGGAAT